MSCKNMKLNLISPKKKTDGNEREVWDGKLISLVYGIPKYSCAFLSLPTLAVLTPPDVTVSIIDENIEDIDFDEDVDIIGITLNTWLAPRAYEIADEFRKRGITVTLGGIHPSMLPQEAIKHADAVVIGEAENVWANLINDYKKGKLQRFYQSPERPNLENQPIPRWDLLKNNKYSYHTIQTTRGCPYDCEFCTVKAMSGSKYRCKPIESTIKEVEALLDIEKKLFFFVDDNFAANKRRVKKLLRELTPLKIVYFTQVSLDIAKDEGLLEALARSGCRKVVIGFESISETNLRQMNKNKIYQVKEYKRYIEIIQSYGIEIQGHFIFGYDYDDESIFEKTVEFIIESNLSAIVFGLLTPFPGTMLCNRLEKEGRLLHKDWTKYDGSHICFQPKLMSPQALQNGSIWARQEIYSYESIFKRLKGLWELWNRTGVRQQDRISPIIVNLSGNDVAYSYPKIVNSKDFTIYKE